MTALRALQRFARSRPVNPPSLPFGCCELCAVALEGTHAHVADLERRAICCACQACAILFEESGAARGRYRTVPKRVVVDPAFQVTDAEWASLQIPVRLAFIFRNSAMQRWIAVYPSPAGPTEGELPEAAWMALLSRSAMLQEMQPDVEALLVRREHGGRDALYLVPIDVCYDLVGRVRRQWEGLSDGGDALRADLERFFSELRARSRPFAGKGGRA